MKNQADKEQTAAVCLAGNHNVRCSWAVCCVVRCQLAGSRVAGSAVEVDLLDPDGFDSAAFGGQMVCSEVMVVGCRVCVYVLLGACVCRGS